MVPSSGYRSSKMETVQGVLQLSFESEVESCTCKQVVCQIGVLQAVSVDHDFS